LAWGNTVYPNGAPYRIRLYALQSKPSRLLLCGRLIDPSRDLVVEGGCVYIEGSTIKSSGSRGEVEAPPDVAECELPSGATILPGLIDAHIHITGFRSGDYVREALTTPFGTLVARGIRDLERVLDAGFTTIVDAGSIISLHLRQAEREGVIRAPRIVAAGYTLSQTFGHGDIHFLPVEYVDARSTRLLTPFQTLLCDGADECRKAARYALRAGADFIKIFTTGGVASQLDRPEYPQFTVEEIRAIVEEARRARRFVHAHAEGAEGIVNALEAGVTRIAHAIYIDDEGIRLALEKNAVVIPTLTVVKLLVEHGEEAGVPSWALEKAREVYKVHVENIRRAYRAGVRMATGTDIFFSPPGLQLYGRNAVELHALVEDVGMRPMEALKAATVNAAYVAGLEGVVGGLREGMKADVIVVRGNPLSDIRVLLDPSNIILVVKEGATVKSLVGGCT
jgi:imidazolonepropionase-like amidohydrolase